MNSANASLICSAEYHTPSKSSDRTSTLTRSRKRRTVLYLFQEDYNYLSEVAEADVASKNVSMHRLVKALRKAGVRSFIQLEQHLKRATSESVEQI